MRLPAVSGPAANVSVVSKARLQYRCSECRHVTGKWVGRCPECGTWGTVDEVAALAAVGGVPQRVGVPSTPAVPISSIDPDRTRHFPTGVSELDRVLAGERVRREKRCEDAVIDQSARSIADFAST